MLHEEKNCGENIFLFILVCIFVIITIIAEVEKKEYVIFFMIKSSSSLKSQVLKKLQCPLFGQTSSCGVYLADRLYVHRLMQFVKQA